MTKNNNIVLDDQFWEKYEKTREWFLTPTEKKKPKDSYKVLASYHLVLERAVFWSSREDYRLLVRDFVNKKIDGPKFERSFMRLRSRNMIEAKRLIDKIEDDEQNEIPDFSYSFNSIAFLSTINNLFYTIEGFLPPESWDDLRACIEKGFLPILERFTMDLDKLIDRSYNILYGTALITIGFGLMNLNLQ